MTARAVVRSLLCRASRLFQSGGRLAQYLAAGTLRTADLQALTREAWRRFGDDDIDDGFMRWEEQMYTSFLAPGDRILVVGCGTGRDLFALLDRGHDVEGLDFVPECVEVARRRAAERGAAVPIHLAPIQSAVLPRAFDAVVFSYFSYSYIPGRANRVAVLRRLGGQLTPRGRILISYALADPPHRLLTASARAVGRALRSDWLLEPGDLVLLRRGSVYFAHTFDGSELESEAAAAGLEVAHHERTKQGVAVLTCPTGQPGTPIGRVAEGGSGGR